MADNYLDFFSQPKAAKPYWTPPAVTPKTFGMSTTGTDDVGRQDWFDTLQGIPKYKQSLDAPVQPSMLDTFTSWFKDNMGTAKEPGLIPMGFGGLMSLGNLAMANKQYGLQKNAFNFNKDMQLKSYGNQVKSYNDTIASNAQADASNLFGARVGSDANTAYVNQMKKERSIT